MHVSRQVAPVPRHGELATKHEGSSSTRDATDLPVEGAPSGTEPRQLELKRNEEGRHMNPAEVTCIGTEPTAETPADGQHVGTDQHEEKKEPRLT